MTAALKNFIDRRNQINTLFNKGDAPLQVDTLTQAQANDLFHSVDTDMSPENLCCDGELPAREVRKRATHLKRVISDLESLGFTKPNNVWNI